MDEVILNTEKAEWTITTPITSQQLIIQDSGVSARADTTVPVKRYEFNSTSTDPITLTWNSIDTEALQVTINSIISDGFICNYDCVF